jgi:preprotein translocase subunit SecE
MLKKHRKQSSARNEDTVGEGASDNKKNSKSKTDQKGNKLNSPGKSTAVHGQSEQDDNQSKVSFIGQSKLYFRDSWLELKKVHTPTRQETLQSTLVTVSIMFFFAIVLALLDWIFKAIIWRIL